MPGCLLPGTARLRGTHWPLGGSLTPRQAQRPEPRACPTSPSLICLAWGSSTSWQLQTSVLLGNSEAWGHTPS